MVVIFVGNMHLFLIKRNLFCESSHHVELHAATPLLHLPVFPQPLLPQLEQLGQVHPISFKSFCVIIISITMVIIITHLCARGETCEAGIVGIYNQTLQDLANRLSVVIIKV